MKYKIIGLGATVALLASLVTVGFRSQAAPENTAVGLNVIADNRGMNPGQEVTWVVTVHATESVSGTLELQLPARTGIVTYSHFLPGECTVNETLEVDVKVSCEVSQIPDQFTVRSKVAFGRSPSQAFARFIMDGQVLDETTGFVFIKGSRPYFMPIVVR